MSVELLRMISAVIAAMVGLAFWWGLSEPLPLPPGLLLAVAAGFLLSAGIIAGRFGAIAAPVALLFSLFLGSIIATQLHQAYVASFPPVARLGRVIAIEWPVIALPLLAAAVIGAIGGAIGERLLPSRRVTLAERQRRRGL